MTAHKRCCNVDQIEGFLLALKRLCQTGSLQKALFLVYHAHESGFPVSTKVFSCLLQACSSNGDLHTGRDVYSWILRIGFKNIFLANQLIRMFASCGSLLDANHVFNNLRKPNLITWTEILSAHVSMGHNDEAVSLYARMRELPNGDTKPDPHVFVAVLKACANMGNLSLGKLIHADIKQSGLEEQIFVANSLINMYAKCDCLLDARTVFRKLQEPNVVTWGSLISACWENGQSVEAFDLFAEMRRAGISPSRATLLCVLKACSSDKNLNNGKCIHNDIVECGLESEALLGNTLVDVYAKSGSLDDACCVFQRLPRKDTVAWSMMVEAFDQEGCGEDAFLLYQQMQEEGVDPDQVSFLSILKVCVSTGALRQGMLIHDHIVHSGFETDPFICNTLVNMYIKCGSIDDACRLFCRLQQQNVVGWNAMIRGYAECMQPKFAFECWEEMKSECLMPNSVTTLSLLSAWSRAGLVGESADFVNPLLNELGTSQTHSHHNCIVHLLGSTGQLMDADHILQTMPSQPNLVGWRSLLNHCKSHGSSGQGQQCFDSAAVVDGR